MRAAVLVAVLSLTIVSLSTAQDAPAAMRKPLNIPAEDLGSALETLAKERGLQLIYRADLVGNAHTAGAVGDFTAEEALKQLLAGTGLTYRYLAESTVTITPRTSSPPAKDENEAAEESSKRPRVIDGGRSESVWDRFRLAQMDQGALASSSSVEKKAQENSDQNSVKLEEVIVTAQKREERLIDVPTSIVVMGADELQQRQITTLEDLASAVPDLYYTKVGNGYVYEIRGISNNSGSSSLVGLYIDEADATLGGASVLQINPVTYDLDRVEVLRGPQGTLYGEGSAGGTIRLITKNPNLNQFSFDSDVAALFTEGGGPSQRINAVVNVPLVENQLGLRIAGTSEHDGGWIDQPAADRKDINERDLTNVRIKGLWKPDPQLTVSAMAIINRDDRGFDFSDMTSPYTWTQVFNLTTTPRVRSDYELYNLTITYDLRAAQILNTTSYISAFAPTRNYGIGEDDSPQGTTSDVLSIPYQFVNDHLLTDELRLTSIGSGRLQWTVGGFYRHYRDLVDLADIYFGKPDAPLPAPFPSSTETTYESWSAFGDASYRLWDRFTLGAGVRYFREHQTFADFVALSHQTGKFSSTDPRVYAQFKLTPDMNIYASAAKGFRSGGFNSVGQPTYDPESVWSYELGTKMAFLEGRIGFDTAVFLSNYTGFQTYAIVPGANGFSAYENAGEARLKGVEGNFTWRPSHLWSLEARGDYVNGRFIAINNTLQTAYSVGDPVDFVPRYQFTLSAQHDFSWLGRRGFARLDYNQQGPMTERNRSIGPWYYAKTDVIQLLNFDTSLMLNDNLRVGFVAQNLLNDQGFVNPYYLVGAGLRSRPRTFGLNFSMAFD